MTLRDAVSKSRSYAARQSGVEVHPMGSIWAAQGYLYHLPGFSLEIVEGDAARIINERSGRTYDPNGWEPVY